MVSQVQLLGDQSQGADEIPAGRLRGNPEMQRLDKSVNRLFLGWRVPAYLHVPLVATVAHHVDTVVTMAEPHSSTILRSVWCGRIRYANMESLETTLHNHIKSYVMNEVGRKIMCDGIRYCRDGKCIICRPRVHASLICPL